MKHELPTDPTPTPEQPHEWHPAVPNPVDPSICDHRYPNGSACRAAMNAAHHYARPEQDEAVRLLRAVVQHWDAGSIDHRYDEMTLAFDDARDFLHRNGGVATPPPATPAALDDGRRWAYEAAVNVVREVHPECSSLGTLTKMLSRLTTPEASDAPE